MTATQSHIIQDPTAWPWPGGRWRSLALDRPQATARRRPVRAWTVALVAFQAFVLVVGVSIAAGLGATSFPDVVPGRAAPTAPFAPPPGPRAGAPADASREPGGATNGTIEALWPTLPGPLPPPEPPSGS